MQDAIETSTKKSPLHYFGILISASEAIVKVIRKFSESPIIFAKFYFVIAFNWICQEMTCTM